jgi:hypothetical protein
MAWAAMAGRSVSLTPMACRLAGMSRSSKAADRSNGSLGGGIAAEGGNAGEFVSADLSVEPHRRGEEQRIAQSVRSVGTGAWLLAPVQRALRQTTDGLTTVSTYTIWCVVHEAGFRWTDRSWCETGMAIRKRKGGTIAAHDPDAEAIQYQRRAER